VASPSYSPAAPSIYAIFAGVIVDHFSDVRQRACPFAVHNFTTLAAAAVPGPIFEIATIRALLALQDTPECPCGQIDAITRDHPAAIDNKISQLVALRTGLQGNVGSPCWRRGCRVLGH
jgi:hypothetical protein